MPFWALIALYVYDDPFMVLRKYEVYDSDVMLNEQLVGWQIYRNHKDSVHFNSFILGNRPSKYIRITNRDLFNLVMYSKV